MAGTQDEIPFPVNDMYIGYAVKNILADDFREIGCGPGSRDRAHDIPVMNDRNPVTNHGII